MFFPVWSLIIIGCVIGWGVIAHTIGTPSHYDFGLSGLAHLLNIAFWVIVALSGILIYNWIG